jgi:glycosyltransferase involved in cell wall biosynthesis
VDPLAEALRELTALSDEERQAMGLRGRDWIQRDFSWEGIGAKMKAAYAWLLGQGEKPAWVRID